VGSISAATVTFPSDENIKEDITVLSTDSASYYISQFSPKTFIYNQTTYENLNLPEGHQYGLIAQEVEAITPSLVNEITYPAEYDSTGAIVVPSLTIKGLDYDDFVPMLIADAQNKNEIIHTQDSLITDLNERLTLLEDCLEGILPWLCSMTSSAIETMDEGTQEDLENSLNVTLSNGQNIILDQNVPNPFAERTTISYTLPDAVQQAQIMFYDLNGQLINTVDVQTRGKGQLNVYGSDLSSGIYTYTLVADGKIVATKRMVKVE